MESKKLIITADYTHNPDYKLISAQFDPYTEVVYGITNEGANEGLEVYHYKKPLNVGSHFHRSFRYAVNNLPQKYKNIFEYLKSMNSKCKSGHKIEVAIY